MPATAYLLAWNPKRAPWKARSGILRRVRCEGYAEFPWTVAAKSVEPGNPSIRHPKRTAGIDHCSPRASSRGSTLCCASTRPGARLRRYLASFAHSPARATRFAPPPAQSTHRPARGGATRRWQHRRIRAPRATCPSPPRRRRIVRFTGVARCAAHTWPCAGTSCLARVSCPTAPTPRPRPQSPVGAPLQLTPHLVIS